VVACPLVPDVPHLRAGSCSSPRTFAPRFLQTPPHGDALALRLSFGSTSTWTGDFHPQAVRHARHTRSASAAAAQPYRFAFTQNRSRAAVGLHAVVYARHGREFVGCKSPVGGSPSWSNHDMRLTTSPRQGRHREVGSAGSRRPRCEARNTNGIKGSRPWDELAQHTEVR